MGEMTGEMTDMERILGMLGGAELVEVYKKLEKVHKHTPWFPTLVGQYSKILKGFESGIFAAADRFLTECRAMHLNDSDGWMHTFHHQQEINEQQKNILRMDVGGQDHTISATRAKELGGLFGLLGDEDVQDVQGWDVEMDEGKYLIDRDPTNYPDVLRPLGESIGPEPEVKPEVKAQRMRERIFLSIDENERPRHQQPPPTAEIIQYLLVTAFQIMKPYTQRLDAHNIKSFNPESTGGFWGPSLGLVADEVSDAASDEDSMAESTRDWTNAAPIR